MNAAELTSQIDAARAYEGLFVPALFAQWGPVLIEAANLQPGQSVLDVACGTGALTAQIATTVGSSGYAAGLDANPGMVAVAREKMPTVDWHNGVAEDLLFDDAVLDAVVSQFGLMFFTDREKAVREMIRVLKPGGRLAIAVWDAIEQSPGYDAELQLIERLGGQAAGNAVRVPFALGDRDALMTLAQSCGVQSPRVEAHRGRAVFPSIRTMVEAELRGWLPIMDVHLSEDIIATILRDAEDELARFATADGQVSFDVSALVVSGSKALSG